MVKIRYTFLSVTIIIIAALTNTLPVAADEIVSSACSETQASLSGGTFLQATTYDIYVKSPNHEQSKLYVQRDTCSEISAAFTPSDNWQVVGTITASAQESVTFYLYNNANSNDVNANRPSLMILPENSGVSIANNAPTIELQGTKATVVPIQNDLETNSLSLLTIVPLSTDKIERVDYYIDSEFRYSKSTVEPFEGYLITDPDAQLLTRVIVYNSGQQVVIEESPVKTAALSPFQSLAYLLSRMSAFLSWALMLILILLLMSIVRRIIAWRVRKRMWLIAHGLKPATNAYTTFWARMRASPAYQISATWASICYRILRTVIPVIAVFLALISWIFDINVINGHSMEHTIKDHSHALINKASVTLTRLFSGSSYVPQRGEIVILKTALTISSTYASSVRPSGTIIKRVVGLPGERVVVNGDKITITPTTGKSFNVDEGQPWQASMQHETRPIHIDVTLKTDEIFVAGDNRPGSIDSRIIGPFRLDQLVGPVVATF